MHPDSRKANTISRFVYGIDAENSISELVTSIKAEIIENEKKRTVPYALRSHVRPNTRDEENKVATSDDTESALSTDDEETDTGHEDDQFDDCHDDGVEETESESQEQNFEDLEGYDNNKDDNNNGLDKDRTDASLYATKSNDENLSSDTSSSDDVSSDNFSRRLVNTRILVTLTPSNLPIKKRILQSLGFVNGDNIKNQLKPVGDRYYRSKPRAIEAEGEMRRNIDASRDMLMSSGQGNARVVRRTDRKFNTSKIELSVMFDPKIDEHRLTEDTLYHLSFIDFDQKLY